MNLLLDNLNWFYDSATFSAGQYNLEINGAFSNINGAVAWNLIPLPAPGSRVAATVTWNVTTPTDGDDIWFVIADDAAIVFSLLLVPFGSPTTNGSFSFDVAVSTYPVITTSDNELEINPPPSSYSALGTLQMIPTPTSPPACVLTALNDIITVTAPGVAIANIYANDTLCPGAVGAATSLVPSALTFNALSGEVSVNIGAAQGLYSFFYALTIAEVDVSSARVIVTYNPPPPPPPPACYPPVCGCALPACNGA